MSLARRLCRILEVFDLVVFYVAFLVWGLRNLRLTSHFDPIRPYSTQKSLFVPTRSPQVHLLRQQINQNVEYGKSFEVEKILMQRVPANLSDCLESDRA